MTDQTTEARVAAERTCSVCDGIGYFGNPADGINCKACRGSGAVTDIACATPPAPIPAMGEREAFERTWNAIPAGATLCDDADFQRGIAWLGWQSRAALSTPSPSPSEGLTEEERQLLVGALNSAEQLMLNGDEYSRGRARDLVIGVRRKLDRLVKEGK